MNTVSLQAEQRKILGRKVKKLRHDGLIPAHIFGHKIKTSHIQVNHKDFVKVEKEAGETGLVEIKIGSDSHPVLIRAIQQDPVTDHILHIDFYQVNLKEKVKVNVPVEITGESPAVESKIGLLLTPISEIEVEALPADLPESIKVDISKLENLDDAILVKNLKVPTGVEIQVDPEETVAKIAALVTKEAEELMAEEAADRAEAETVTEGAEGAGEEGAAVETKGEEPSSDGAQPEEKPQEDKSE